MKLKLMSIKGEIKGDINIPLQFNEEIRPDLIKRAVLSIQSQRRQAYGSDPEAGKKHSSKISRRRRNYKGSYGHGISRVPRKIVSRRGTRFNWIGATSPNTVGGRRAHPPKTEKNWFQKINKKEKRKALRSALAATLAKEEVINRGHLIGEKFPLIIEDDLEKMAKTKQINKFLYDVGLEKELKRICKKKIRAGRGKSRGRKYKTKKGPLFVVSQDCDLLNSSKNLPGIDIALVNNLNIELLAPGAACGRLTIYTRSAIERIENEKLFTEETQHVQPDKTNETIKKPKPKKDKKEKETKSTIKKENIKQDIKQEDKKQKENPKETPEK
ncbi:50S ribosomal protein L4 [Candidatus Woesearchaeota archaeon]|nr:50S ribosomal protein L4 [Candidatus Woesearchaeota archaeon]